MTDKNDDQYTPEQITQRADAAIRKALATPHSPHRPMHKVDAMRKKPKAKDSDKPDSGGA